MKAGLLAAVLAVLAPAHVRLGPVSVPVAVLAAAAEVLLTAGGIWVIARIIRRARPRLARIPAGAP